MTKDSRFVPTDYIWVVVYNENYAKRREFPKNNFGNLPEVLEDKEDVLEAFKNLGARSQDIFDLPDANYDQLS